MCVYIYIYMYVWSQKILWYVTLLPCCQKYTITFHSQGFLSAPQNLPLLQRLSWLNAVPSPDVWERQWYEGTADMSLHWHTPSTAPTGVAETLRALPFSFCFGPVLFFFLLSSLLNSGHSCRYLVTQTLSLSASLINVPFKVKAVSFLLNINLS